MVVETPLSLESTKNALSWPIPPFFRVVDPLPVGQSRACSIELMNGAKFLADLIVFDANEDSISLIDCLRWITGGMDRGQVVTHLLETLLGHRRIRRAIIEREGNEKHPLHISEEAADFGFCVI